MYSMIVEIICKNILCLVSKLKFYLETALIFIWNYQLTTRKKKNHTVMNCQD